MKIIKTASGKYKLTKQAWEEIGKKAGWTKEAQTLNLEDNPIVSPEEEVAPRNFKITEFDLIRYDPVSGEKSTYFIDLSDGPPEILEAARAGRMKLVDDSIQFEV